MNSLFIFLFLAIFPFGQLFHLGFNLFGVQIAPQPIDIVVGLGALYAILTKLKKPKIFKYFDNFLIVAGFSFILSIFIFKSIVLLYGFLYLVRLFAYTYFLIYVWNFVRADKSHPKLLINSLLAISIASTVFGWFQFFIFPTIKPLFVLGWDEHTFRLVGTFLDPGFLGLIIVFGLLLSIHRCIDRWNWKYVLITIFLLVSLAFTYSRASYLAFLAGGVALGILMKKIKYILYLGIILMALIVVLPTSRNHSIEFLRTFSIAFRIDNYRETLQIVKKFPVFGAGFDNLCLARNEIIGPESFFSHSCSGSDSSILFVLATTGVAGLMILAYGLKHIAYSLRHNSYFITLSASAAALLIHSLFSNSLFYAWIMGYMVILLSITITE